MHEAVFFLQLINRFFHSFCLSSLCCVRDLNRALQEEEKTVSFVHKNVFSIEYNRKEKAVKKCLWYIHVFSFESLKCVCIKLMINYNFEKIFFFPFARP